MGQPDAPQARAVPVPTPAARARRAAPARGPVRVVPPPRRDAPRHRGGRGSPAKEPVRRIDRPCREPRRARRSPPRPPRRSRRSPYRPPGRPGAEGRRPPPRAARRPRMPGVVEMPALVARAMSLREDLDEEIPAAPREQRSCEAALDRRSAHEAVDERLVVPSRATGTVAGSRLRVDPNVETISSRRPAGVVWKPYMLSWAPHSTIWIPFRSGARRLNGTSSTATYRPARLAVVQNGSRRSGRSATCS